MTNQARGLSNNLKTIQKVAWVSIKKYTIYFQIYFIKLLNVSYDNAFDKRCEARQMRRRLEEILDTPFMKQLK